MPTVLRRPPSCAFSPGGYIRAWTPQSQLTNPKNSQRSPLSCFQANRARNLTQGHFIFHKEEETILLTFHSQIPILDPLSKVTARERSLMHPKHHVILPSLFPWTLYVPCCSQHNHHPSSRPLHGILPMAFHSKVQSVTIRALQNLDTVCLQPPPQPPTR